MVRLTQPTHEVMHAEHMKRVRAVQRRSEYERVRRQIADIKMKAVILGDHEQEQLVHLLALSDTKHAEMVAHGQIDSPET